MAEAVGLVNAASQEDRGLGEFDNEQDDDDNEDMSPENADKKLTKFKRKKKKVQKGATIGGVVGAPGAKADSLPGLDEVNSPSRASFCEEELGPLMGLSEEQREALVAVHRRAIQKVVMESYQHMLEAIMQHTSTLQVSLGLGAQQPLTGMEISEFEKSYGHNGLNTMHGHGHLHSQGMRNYQGVTVGRSTRASQNFAGGKEQGKHKQGFFEGMANSVAQTVHHEIHGTKARARISQCSRMGEMSANGEDYADRSSELEAYDQEAQKAKPKGIFADADAMKAQLREAITKETYEVSNFYWEHGCAQAVARSIWFEHLTLFVIAINAIWIAVDVDLNTSATIADADTIFVVADNFFCFYFCFEWTVRYSAFEKKSSGLKDRWFLFDSAMCAMMVGETWLLPVVLRLSSGGGAGDGLGDASLLKIFRMLRLLRMARMIRLLNALPELMVLIKGMKVAFRAVSCTVMLLLMIIYVFAVAFRQLTDGTPIGDSTFTTVPMTMRFLLVQGTMPDLYDAVMPIWHYNDFYALFFLLFVLIVSITVMNMLVGVLVGVVNTVATVEKEQLMVHFVKTNLLELLNNSNADEDQDGKISRKEFDQLIQVPLAIRSFDQMGVDVVGLVDLADFIFKDEDHTLTISDFFELVMQLRGSNQATVKDIVDLRKCVTLELGQLRADLMMPMNQHAYTAKDIVKNKGGRFSTTTTKHK